MAAQTATFSTNPEFAAKLAELMTTYPEEAKQVFANMMFNMGRTRLSKFKKMIAGAEASDWKEAASQGRDSRWYNQVTNRAERLMLRLENV